MSAQTAADLRAAADVLKRDGWTQHGYFDGRRCCQAGALIRVIEPGVRRTGEMSSEALGRWMRAERALGMLLGSDNGVGAPIDWNDAEGRTADEVIAAFRAAADQAEAQS